MCEFSTDHNAHIFDFKVDEVSDYFLERLLKHLKMLNFLF